MNEFEPKNISDHQLPIIQWEKRGKKNTMRIYWRTVFHVIARKGKLDDYMSGPVCPKSTKEFQKRIFGHAFIAWFFAVILTFFVPTIMKEEISTTHYIAAIAAMHIGALSICYMIEAMTWFFCPKNVDRELQDRMIALSRYSSAPLALTLAIPIIFGISMLIIPAEYIKTTLIVIGGLYMAAILYWYRIILGAIHSLTGRRVKRTVFVAIMLPLVWIGQLLLIGIIPVAIVMWILMIMSLS